MAYGGCMEYGCMIKTITTCIVPYVKVDDNTIKVDGIEIQESVVCSLMGDRFLDYIALEQLRDR
jgi:hypothetical protein